MENNLTEYILNQESDSIKQQYYNEDIDEDLRKFLLEDDDYKINKIMKTHGVSYNQAYHILEKSDYGNGRKW